MILLQRNVIKYQETMSTFTEKNINTSDIVVILDNSGSMQTMGVEPVQAVNEFIEEQKKTGPDSLFSLWKFSTKSEKVVDNVKLCDVENLAMMDPHGGTALYDTIELAIKDNLEKKNLVVVIVTDGLDNMSQVCNAVKSKSMIIDCEKNKGWKFHYLGANQDSFEVANKGLGITSCQNYTVGVDGIRTGVGLTSILRSTSASVSAHRQTSLTVDTSRTDDEDEDDDELAGLELHQPPVLKRSSHAGAYMEEGLLINNDEIVNMAVEMLSEKTSPIRRTSSN